MDDPTTNTTPIDFAQLVDSLAFTLVSESEPGSAWDICLIEEGRSLNGNTYGQAVLESGAALFDGCKVFAYELAKSFHDHLPDDLKAQVGDGAGLARNLVGVVEGVSFQERDGKRGLFGTLKVVAPWMRTLLREAWQIGKRNLLGFSIDARARFDGDGNVLEFAPNPTLDVVSHPAAGGELVRMVASIRGNNAMDDHSKNPQPETDAQPQEDAQPEVDVDRIAESAAQAATAAAEMRISCNEAVVDILADSNLPAPAQKRIRESMRARSFDTVEAATTAANAQIEAERQYIDSVTSAPQVDGAGDAREAAQPGSDVLDRLQTAMDGMLAGKNLALKGDDSQTVPRFRGFREAWFHITEATRPRDPITGAALGKNLGMDMDPRRVLALAAGYTPPDYYRQWGRVGESFQLGGGFRRNTEAISTSTFAEILGDSVTRRMMAENALPQLNEWKRVVSEVTDVADFRTQRRQQLGGFGTLSSVSEGDNYLALTSPGDAEETYSVSKFGGTESLTWESLLNDDIGALRRIPVKLGRAAAQTLNRDILDLVTTDNPTMNADATALYHANHNNTAGVDISGDALRDGRVAMRSQTAYGDTSEILGAANSPKILIVPNELEDVARTFIDSTVSILEATEANPTQMALANGSPIVGVPNVPWIRQLELIVYDVLTDADAAYLLADPGMQPTVEVGFLGGRQEPELFVQQIDSGVGSAFTADKLTYKVRHVYGFTVLDWRSFYRIAGV